MGYNDMPNFKGDCLEAEINNSLSVLAAQLITGTCWDAVSCTCIILDALTETYNVHLQDWCDFSEKPYDQYTEISWHETDKTI